MNDSHLHMHITIGKMTKMTLTQWSMGDASDIPHRICESDTIPHRICECEWDTSQTPLIFFQYLHTYVCVYTCMCSCKYVFIDIYIHTRTPTVYICICEYVYVSTHEKMGMQIWVYTHQQMGMIWVYTHLLTHAYTHSRHACAHVATVEHEPLKVPHTRT